MEWNRRGKDKITKSERMISKLKREIITIDYELDLLKKMQRLKQARKYVQEYTKYFYQVFIRNNHVEVDKEKVAYYINGLKLSIEEELSLV